MTACVIEDLLQIPFEELATSRLKEVIGPEVTVEDVRTMLSELKINEDDFVFGSDQLEALPVFLPMNEIAQRYIKIRSQLRILLSEMLLSVR